MEYDYGTNLKFSYKVTEEEALSASELEDIRYNLEMDYNMDSSSVKKGYKLDVDVTIKGSEDSDTEEMELIAIQIGSKWYIGEPDEWDDMLYISFIFW